MQYSLAKSCLVALAAVSSVVAQTPGFDVFTAPSTPGSVIPAGSTYNIQWTPSAPAGKIDIILLQGSSNITLQPGPTIASSIDSVNGNYNWTVPSTGTSFATYGLKIQFDTDNSIYQYSTFFAIGGIGGTSSASTTVTVKVSQVSTATTVTASSVTVSKSTTSSAATSVSYPNSTITTTQVAQTSTKAPAVAGSSTGSAPATTSSSAAMGSIAIGGTGLLSALMVTFGMLL